MRKMNRLQFRGSFLQLLEEELEATTNFDGCEMTNERAIAKAMIALAKRGNIGAAKFVALRENDLEPGPPVINLIVHPDDLLL